AGDYSANKLNIDDAGFLTGMVDKLITEIGVDPARVFATGISRGGHMAFRLALEAPSRFRAVATVSASVPTPENFKCTLSGHGIPQPYWRYPRFLGPAPKEPNGPAVIWAFFERQRPK